MTIWEWFCRMKFYLNNKKITKKALVEMLGKERLDRLIAEAKQLYMEDPYIDNSVFIGNGLLKIEFELK